jgi:HK97 family phage major capsid protein
MTNNQIVVEMRQQLGAIVEQMKVLNDLVEKEKREFTTAEGQRWESLEQEVRRLEGQINRDEIQLGREAELARVGSNGSHQGELRVVGARWSTPAPAVSGSQGYETGTVLNPNDSFRTALEQRGNIKQGGSRYENVSLGALIRGIFSRSKESEVRAALAESSDSLGGVSVPDIVMARFVDTLRAAVVCMRAGAVTVPLTSDKTTIARTASDPVAAWRAEAGPVSESEPTFEAILFTARSLDVLIKASREVIEDSVNIEKALEAALRGAFAVELDRAALVGSGSAPEPRGVANITNVGSVAGGGALTSYDKIMDAVYEILKDNAPMPTGIIMPPRTAVALAKLKTGLTSDNTPLRVPELIANIPRYVTTSLPITEAPGTASRIIMGSFNQLYFGIRADLRIQVANELYAANGQIGFFANLRCDVQVAHPESFAMVTGILP